MKKILTVFLSVLLLWCCLSLGAKDFPLIIDGKSSAVFLKSTDKSIVTAQKQFNEDIFRCTGTKIPVAAKPSANSFVIKFKLEKRPVEKEDDFSITFPDRKTMLITCSSHSAGTALRYILEEYAGVRYLFPAVINKFYGEEINHYPRTKKLSVPRKTVSKKPSFYLNRRVDYHAGRWDHRWNRRSRIRGGHMIPIDVFPVYKYAKDQSWPKNMLPLIGGKRYMPPKAKKPLSKNPYLAVRNYNASWNPCFSHPDTTRIAIENILEILKKNPDKACITMGINDNGGMCECSGCLKVVGRKYNSVGRRNYSPLYWKWVHDVATEVTKKYPNVYFACLAYREVLNPPAFKLHKKVLPQICFELNAMNDKEVYKRRLKLLQEWKKKAHTLDFWDYSEGINFFLFPRIYFKSHSERLKLLYEHNVRSMFVECYAVFPFEGPKYYLMQKMLFDINRDPEKIVRDWCNAAVGKKSAPYLLKFYDFWEKYWERKELADTVWYSSRFSTYMRLGDPGSYTLALQRGEMKYLRSLMEKVVANAVTPQEKRRAGVLMKFFELSEDSAKVLFSEYLQGNGSLKNKEDAIAMLRSIPSALSAQKRLRKNPFVKYHQSKGELESNMLAHLGALLPLLKDKDVRNEVKKLSQDPAMPPILRGMFKIYLGEKSRNLIVNGSFEKPLPMPQVLWNEGGAYRSAKKASHGDFALRVPNSSYAFHIKILPKKTYIFLFDVYSKLGSVEGRISYQLTARNAKRRFRTTFYLNNSLPTGKWTSFSGICAQIEQADSIRLLFYLRKLEDEDEVYVDNFRAYCLDDLVAGKK